jgi:hypothetical protein
MRPFDLPPYRCAAAIAVIYSIYFFSMKYYLVARSYCCMVGIEQCRGYVVGRSSQAAFEREFAGRILMVASAPQSLPGISYVAYQGPPGPSFNHNKKQGG